LPSAVGFTHVAIDVDVCHAFCRRLPMLLISRSSTVLRR
jgi:hypothetical protein